VRLDLFILNLHTQGEADEYIYLPICAGCDEPITDFESANVIADYGSLGSEPKDPVPAGTLSGVLLSRQPLESLECFHIRCDPRDHKRFQGWARCSTIFRKDQRPRFLRAEQ